MQQRPPALQKIILSIPTVYSFLHLFIVTNHPFQYNFSSCRNSPAHYFWTPRLHCVQTLKPQHYLTRYIMDRPLDEVISDRQVYKTSLSEQRERLADIHVLIPREGTIGVVEIAVRIIGHITNQERYALGSHENLSSHFPDTRRLQVEVGAS